MGKLAEALLSQDNRPAVIRDCAQLIDGEVARKTGITGMAIKGGYKIFKKVKPGIVEEAMDSLLDEFVEKLDPIYEEYRTQHAGESLERYLVGNGPRIADTLLEITDGRAKASEHRVIKKAYYKLRPMAEKQIQDALPAVSKLVEKYVGTP